MSALFKLRNLLLLLAISLAVGLAAVVIIRYRPAAIVPVVVPALPAGIDLALQKVDYTHTEGGVARWRLVASRAEHQAESKLMLVRDMHLTFFDEKGREQMALKARNGQINGDYSVVEVNDDVELVHANGYTLHTRSLSFSQADGLILTRDPVRLTGRDVTLDGVGLRVDLAKRRLHVLGGVQATLSRQSR